MEFTSWVNIIFMFYYSQHYDWQVHSHVYNSSNQLVGFKVDMLYSPPMPGNYYEVYNYPDPDDLSELGIRIEINYNLIIVQ